MPNFFILYGAKLMLHYFLLSWTPEFLWNILWWYFTMSNGVSRGLRRFFGEELLVLKKFISCPKSKNISDTKTEHDTKKRFLEFNFVFVQFLWANFSFWFPENGVSTSFQLAYSCWEARKLLLYSFRVNLSV